MSLWIFILKILLNQAFALMYITVNLGRYLFHLQQIGCTEVRCQVILLFSSIQAI